MMNKILSPLLLGVSMLASTTSAQTLLDVAVENGLTTLIAAANATGQAEVFVAPGTWTVFAPTDEAFAALPAGTLDFLLANVDILSAVLSYHVLDEVVMAADLVSGESLVSLVMEDVLVTIEEDGTVMVNNATVTSADNMAENGVIHIIDQVMVPPSILASLPPPSEPGMTDMPGTDMPMESDMPMETDMPIESGMPGSNETMVPGETGMPGETGAPGAPAGPGDEPAGPGDEPAGPGDEPGGPGDEPGSGGTDGTPPPPPGGEEAPMDGASMMMMSKSLLVLLSTVAMVYGIAL